MRFSPTSLPGALIVEPTPHADERGFFARTWCRDTFAAQGLTAELAQTSVSYNRLALTLRGMHWQAAPASEAKLVRCTHGAVFDVAVDLRPDSPTFGRWAGVELSAANRRMLYVPEGMAHGFLTLEDDTELLYHISAPYEAAGARGFRWDDPDVAIAWPEAPRVISDRDRTLPTFAEATAPVHPSPTASQGDSP